MYKRYRPIIALTLLLAFTLLPIQAIAQSRLTIVTEDSARAHPEEITYGATPDGFEVRGSVKSRFHNGRILGHIDITFIDADGETLKSGRSKLQRSNYSNKHQHRTTFRVLFNELPAGSTTLQVRHHVGGH